MKKEGVCGMDAATLRPRIVGRPTHRQSPISERPKPDTIATATVRTDFTCVRSNASPAAQRATIECLTKRER